MMKKKTSIKTLAARTAMTLVLMLLTTATAWATTTSTINVGGTDYTLFTGFTATDGSTGVGVFTYDKAVDGDMSSTWHDQSSGIYVEFNTDDPIIPKGYIFNTYQAGSFYPQAWVLKAKANATDDWTTLSSYSGQTLSSGQEFQYACGNDGNTVYKYFRFEASNSNNNIWLTEIRLYGLENLTYTHLTVRDATCTEVGIKQECWKRSDGKYFTDETGTTELNEADVIDPMIAHTGVHHEADANHIEYWQCSMCSKYFSDEGCTTEITEAQTLVVKYLDGNGTLTTLDADATTMTSTTTSWTGGWYMLYDDVTISDRISVSGTVNLIIANGATLTASKGITVGSSATLNIYAQSDDEATMGALVATAAANSNNAAIGGVNNTNFGTIVINGGKITATTNSNSGAAIGGGYGSTGGNITINGGIVSATAGDYSNSAGIGGGNNGYVASVTLNGGIITATGDTQFGGAGIGTGAYADSGTMTVTIGSGVKKIVATRGKNSDCIGKQPNASTTVNVVFKNGNTTVTGDDKDAVFYDTGEGTVRQVRAKAMNHAVTMSDDLKANITVNPEYALAGETVTLTLGMAVDASTLKVNDGTSDLTLTDAGNRQYTFTMPDGDVTVTATAAQSYAVNLPANMEVVSATNAADADGKYITGTTVTFKPMFGYEASNVSDGTNTLEPDANGVYSVTVATADITITATVGRSATIDLTNASGDFNAIDNDVLKGSTSHTLTIADGAAITLNGATITGGIVCEGTATITLVGTNSVSVVPYNKAGIQIGGSGTTLTIRGDGSLTANGGDQSAGIGLGRTWDDNATGGSIVIEGGTVTASGDIGIGIGTVGNSQTAAIDGISIKGGTVNASLGKGYIYNGSTATVGYIKVYDGIEMVDASKITETVTYMHGDDDVTASKADYFTIGEDGDRRIIVPKDDTDYTITIADGIEHGTITGATTAKYMETVTINATPDFGYRLVRLVVKDADDNDVASTGNTFLMPKSNVTVSAVFEQGTHGTTEFAWGYPGPDSFVNEATIYDGVTTVNLQTTGQSYSILKYDEYTYYNFLLDNDTYEASIPYAGGTGAFQNGNGTDFNLDYNGETGYYDITMTDAGNGKWSVSILKTAGQMDVVPDQTYTGSAITPEPTVVAGSLSLTKGTDYTYSYTDNTNVGTATVRATFQGDYESLGYVEQTFNIGKATPTVTAPTAIDDLIYNGSAQALVTTGSTDFGTLLYSLDGNTYAADIPTATAAGDYTVYYKVEASDNWEAVDAASIAVTIAPRTYTVTFDANGGEGTMEPMQLTYDGDWTALTANTFTRTGYGFKCWNTEAGGTGTDYDDEGWVRNLTTETSIVLYAQWGEDIAECTATVPDQTMAGYSYIYYKFEAANSDAELAAEMGVVVKDGDDVLTLGTDYEFGNVTFADGSEGMPENVGDECLLEIKGKGRYAGSLWAPFTITVADDGGTWGNLTWSFHAGTLAISGTGAMDIASDYSAYPWFSLASNIKAITIGEGITTIAEAAFSGTSQVNYYSRVASLSLPTTLTAIGAEAFAFCTSLTTAIPQGVTIGTNAFYRVGCLVGSLSDTADNGDVIALLKNALSADVTLSGRTLYKDGKWNTLCLPFNVTISGSDLDGEGVTARPLTAASIDGTTLNLTFGDPVETLVAGTPYIIKWDAAATNIVSPTFSGVTVNSDMHPYDTDAVNSDEDPNNNVTTEERVRFLGTYKSTTFDGDDTSILLMGGSNTLYYPQNGAGIGAQRAYFKIGSDGALLARRMTAFNIGFGDGEETGIISVSTDAKDLNGGAWYTLDGRKLNGKPTKSGIYVNGGRKVVVK